MALSSKRHTIFLIFNVSSNRGHRSMTLLKTLIYSYTQAGRVFWKDLESEDSYGQKSSLEIIGDLLLDSYLKIYKVEGRQVYNLRWKSSISESSFDIEGDSDVNAMITYCETLGKQQPIEIDCIVA